MTTPKGPHIDWAGLSPLLALLGAATLVLLIGLLRPRAVREVLVPLLALAGFLAAIGLGIWQFGEQKDLVAGALRLDDLTIVLSFVFCAGGAAAVLLSWRAVAPREAAHGEYFALMLTSAAGMWVLVAAQNLVTLFLGLELLSIPLYVLCATEMRRATSLEAGLKYLIIGSVGSATLLYGLAFIYGATGSTDFSGIARAAGDVVDRSAAAHRHRPEHGRPRLQGLGGALPPVDARRLRGRPDAGHRLHGRGHQGGGLRRLPAPLRRGAARRQRRLGARAGRARHHHHRRGQRRRAGPELAQAPDGVVIGRAGRLHAGRRRGRHAPRRAGDGLLPRRLPDDEPGRLRGHRHPRARDAAWATTSPPSRGSASSVPCWRWR